MGVRGAGHLHALQPAVRAADGHERRGSSAADEGEPREEQSHARAVVATRKDDTCETFP